MKYLIICCLLYITPYSAQHNFRPTLYKWQEMVKPGNGSFADKWEQGKWPMGIMPVHAFYDQLWMIGREKSWSSPDGINWKSQPKTDWGERHGMNFIFFNNKIWMMGGMRSWDDFRNDIWFSDDGKQWVQAVQHAAWSQRRGHNVAVFKNKLWLAGGLESSGQPNRLPSRVLNDLWSSDDGIHWKQEQASPPWTANSSSRLLVFDGKLWLIQYAGEKSIWNSTDGKNWGLITNDLPWTERGGCAVMAFDKKLWIIGGFGYNDVWHSEDGINWLQQPEPSPWSSRGTEYSIVFKNKLWIFSGKTGREDSWAGDIWAMYNAEN